MFYSSGMETQNAIISINTTIFPFAFSQFQHCTKLDNNQSLKLQLCCGVKIYCSGILTDGRPEELINDRAYLHTECTHCICCLQCRRVMKSCVTVQSIQAVSGKYMLESASRDAWFTHEYTTLIFHLYIILTPAYLIANCRSNKACLCLAGGEFTFGFTRVLCNFPANIHVCTSIYLWLWRYPK